MLISCVKILYLKYFRSRAISLNASFHWISPFKTGDIRVMFPKFSKPRVLRKKIKDNRGNSLHLATLLETVCFKEQTTSVDKYPSIFPRQMKAIVYVSRISVLCQLDCIIRHVCSKFSFSRWDFPVLQYKENGIVVRGMWQYLEQMKRLHEMVSKLFPLSNKLVHAILKANSAHFIR